MKCLKYTMNCEISFRKLINSPNQNNPETFEILQRIQYICIYTYPHRKHLIVHVRDLMEIQEPVTFSANQRQNTI